MPGRARLLGLGSAQSLALALLAPMLLAPILLSGPAAQAAQAADPGAAGEGASTSAATPAASASLVARSKTSAKAAKSSDKSGAASGQPAARLPAEADAPAASPTPTGKEIDKADKNAGKDADKTGHAEKRSSERNGEASQAKAKDPAKVDASHRQFPAVPPPPPSPSPLAATGPASPAAPLPPFAHAPASSRLPSTAPASPGGGTLPALAPGLGLVLAGLGGAWLWRRRRAGVETWSDHLVPPTSPSATAPSPTPSPPNFAALLAGAQDGQPAPEAAREMSAPFAGAGAGGLFQPLALHRDEPGRDSQRTADEWSTGPWRDGARADDPPAADAPTGRTTRADAPLAERFTPFFPEPEEEAEDGPDVLPPEAFTSPPPPEPPPEPPPPPPPACDLFVDFQPTRFAANLGGVTLRYRLILTNRGDLATGPLSITADLLAAGPGDLDGDSPAGARAGAMDEADAVDLPELYRLDRLAVGDMIDLSGHLTLPRSHFTPIRLGAAELLVPLVRIRVVAGPDHGAETGGAGMAGVPAGTLLADSSFLIGEPPQAEADHAAALRPFRIDLAPHTFPLVAGRRL